MKKGYANSKFFFTVTKARNSQNRINLLTDNTGTQITGEQDIKEEILGFYKKLSGSKDSSLPGIDLNIVRAEKSTYFQARSLVREITYNEIEKALAGIDNEKALD